MSKDIIADLKRDEGRNVIDGRHMPYRCTAKKLTLGYGSNIEDNGVSEAVAELMLKEEIERAYRDANSLYGDKLRITMDLQYNEIRWNVIVNMIFNLGITRYKKFKKHIEAVKAQDWSEAADQMVDSSWYKQVGSRAVRLVKEMRTGE